MPQELLIFVIVKHSMSNLTLLIVLVLLNSLGLFFYSNDALISASNNNRLNSLRSTHNEETILPQQQQQQETLQSHNIQSPAVGYDNDQFEVNLDDSSSTEQLNAENLPNPAETTNFISPKKLLGGMGQQGGMGMGTNTRKSGRYNATLPNGETVSHSIATLLLIIIIVILALTVGKTFCTRRRGDYEYIPAK